MKKHFGMTFAVLWGTLAVTLDARADIRGPDLTLNGGSPGKWPLDLNPYYLDTNVSGVFAPGDVRHSSVKRCASAVGEGAMAITFVHRYLTSG